MLGLLLWMVTAILIVAFVAVVSALCMPVRINVVSAPPIIVWFIGGMSGCGSIDSEER